MSELATGKHPRRRAAIGGILGIAALAGVYQLGRRSEAGAAPPGSLQIAGSETMRAVVTTCAEAFMARNPNADVMVRGGGSGDGIAALLHGMVEIGMCSREVSAREREYAASKAIDLVATPLGLDGIAVIVHRSNAIAALNFDQLRRMFSGQARSWRDLGGADGPVTTVARAAGSGTASLFADRVLGPGVDGVADRVHPTNDAILDDVAQRPGAIGYTSLGALRAARDRVRVVPIRIDTQAEAVAPTSGTVRAGTYPLTRSLLLIGAGPASATGRRFLDYCSSPAGQALVERGGYVPAIPA